jgi:hypothetical protein
VKQETYVHLPSFELNSHQGGEQITLGSLLAESGDYTHNRGVSEIAIYQQLTKPFDGFRVADHSSGTTNTPLYATLRRSLSALSRTKPFASAPPNPALKQ